MAQQIERRATAETRVPAWYGLAAFAAVGVVLMVVSWYSTGQPLAPYYKPSWDLGRQFPGDGFLRGWTRWDSGWYLGIAEDGYSFTPGRQSPVAYFPAYPLSMRLLGRVVGHPLLAGILITVAAGAGSAVLFVTWCRRRMGRAATLTALALFLLYPYSWYLYGVVYADALFIVAVLGAFVAMDADRPVVAGLCGIVATAGRPVGLALVAGLVLLACAGRAGLGEGENPGPWALVRRGLPRWRPRDAGVLLSLAGLAAWCTYLWVTFGDAFAFATTESAPGWDNGPGPTTWFKLRILQLIRGDVVEPGGYLEGVLVAGALAIGALCLVPAVVRRFGWAVGTFTMLVIAMPVLSSKDFQGLGRYLLCAFPVFALIGEWLARRPLSRVAVLTLSAFTLVLFTSLYARGYYLA